MRHFTYHGEKRLVVKDKAPRDKVLERIGDYSLARETSLAGGRVFVVYKGDQGLDNFRVARLTQSGAHAYIHRRRQEEIQAARVQAALIEKGEVA